MEVHPTPDPLSSKTDGDHLQYNATKDTQEDWEDSSVQRIVVVSCLSLSKPSPGRIQSEWSRNRWHFQDLVVASVGSGMEGGAGSMR